jgi:hypothetical protein
LSTFALLLGFVNKLFSSVCLDNVLLLDELAQKFQFLQNSSLAKWGFTFNFIQFWLNLSTPTHQSGL